MPIEETTLVCPNNSVAIKNGKRAGTTEFAHNNKPFLVADKFCLENSTKQMVKRTINPGNILFLNDKKTKWDLFFKWVSSY